VLLALSSAQKLGIGLVAGAFVVFALISAMLIPRYRPDFPAKRMGWFITACVIFTVGMLTTIVFVAKETEHEASAETHGTDTEPTGTTPTGTTAEGDPAAGKVVFETNCGSCHTLSDAGTSGKVGPNLDELKPAQDVVEEQVTNGGGAMPAFGGTLTEQQIADVAAYVSSAAGT
jgi:cytochrome c6